MTADYHVGPIGFTDASPTGARDLIADLAHRATDTQIGSHVHLLNMYSLAMASKSEPFLWAVSGSSVNLIDGKPVTWLARRHGARKRRRPHQVRGPQLFEDCLAHRARAGLRHYLLGGTPDCLEALRKRCAEDFPEAEIVGWASPPFRPLTDAERQEQRRDILDSGANVVWVGLGTPKQDLEVAALAAELPVVAVAVGAAFDFTAGLLPPAPAWMRHLALEWLYRLYREPRRLWRRYTIESVRALAFIVRSATVR